MKAEEIRDRLRAFLGDERYAKFVTRLPDTGEAGRLLFWQEKAWEDFVKANPECELGFIQLVEVFADCPLYGVRVRKANYYKLVETWLRGKPFNIENLESPHMVSDHSFGPIPIVFGPHDKRWLKLKSQMQNGDVLREFQSPPETWAMLAGRQGIALVRDGRVIDIIVTVLN